MIDGVRIDAACEHPDRPHTVWFMLNDGGPPIPMSQTWDTQPEAVLAASSAAAAPPPNLQWIKVFRADNEAYTCWRWQPPEPAPVTIRSLEEYDRLFPAATLPWARWRWQRCRAVMPPNSSLLWGRCELVRAHRGDHALERGMETPRWSTRRTDGDPDAPQARP